MNHLHLQQNLPYCYLFEQMERFSDGTTVKTKTLSWVDRMGVYASAMCAVHCLALPLAIAAVPSLSVIVWIGEGVERLLGVAAVGLAIACLCWGFRVHRKKRLFLTFAAAGAFILSGQFFAQGWVEVALVVTGAFGLIGSHLLNRHLCKTCNTCHCDSSAD